MQTETGQIIVQLEGNVIQTIPLTQTVLTIGRAPEMDLSLQHPLVSRAHAEIRVQPQGPVFTDLGSSNGSFLDVDRIPTNQPRLMTDGMSIRIGPYLLTYQAARTSQQLPSDMVGERDEGKQVPVPVPGVQPEPTAVMKAVPPAVPRAHKPARRPLVLGEKSVYNHHLPDIYQDDDFLQRFLHIFEDIWEPLEQRQDHIEMYFDPRTCPVSFLPWLASWLGLSLNPHWPEIRQRRLLAQAMDLYRWRGTRYGLVRMIEVCTGITPVIIENPLEPFVFRIRITLPSDASSGAIDKELIEELIKIHKPAHAGYILEVNA